LHDSKRVQIYTTYTDNVLYCVMSTSIKNQLSNSLKREKAGVTLIVFNNVLYHVRADTVAVALHVSGTVKV